jgi:SAGA-associated factor 73
MNQDLIDSEGVNKTSFQFLSCTGSGTGDLLLGSDQSQIGRLNTSLHADFALLSVGGNDLGFFDIMNSCIFRFYSFYSGTCEEALKRSEQQLASDDFENHLRLVITEILDRVHWERRPWFTITVTGYARFFNAETEACDDSSFGIWWRGPKLKRELRQRMNDMVLSVNAKIRSSIDSVNAGFATPKVFFVDYDARFEGHRFCEEGVIEPDYQRNDTWFFLVGGLDNAETSEEEDEIAAYGALRTPMPQDSPLVDPDTCLEVALASGDWGEMAVCYMAMAKRKDPTLRLASGDVVSEQDMWYVPTYYGQTFHPVSNLSIPKPERYFSSYDFTNPWLEANKGP